MVQQVVSQIFAYGRWIDFGISIMRDFPLVNGFGLQFEKFCSMRERYYLHLIREFYGSFARGGDGWIAIVRGTLISISDELLSQV